MTNFEKIFSYVEKLCYMNVLIGIGGIIAGAVLLGMYSDFSDINESYNIYQIAYVLLIIIGIAFLLAGFLGVYAQRRRRNCGMRCYNVMIIFYLIFVIAVLIVQIAVATKLSDFKDDTNCTKENFLTDFRLVYDSGKSLLCSNNCPCSAESSKFTSDQLSRFVISQDGANKVSQCDLYEDKMKINFKSDHSQSDSDYLKDIVNMLRSMETTFDCSGFCSKSDHYVFRNINDGKPNNIDCKEKFVDLLSSNIIKAIVITSIITLYLIIVSILSLIVMCHPQKKSNGYYPTEPPQTSYQNNNINKNNTSAANINPPHQPYPQLPYDAYQQQNINQNQQQFVGQPVLQQPYQQNYIPQQPNYNNYEIPVNPYQITQQPVQYPQEVKQLAKF